MALTTAVVRAAASRGVARAVANQDRSGAVPRSRRRRRPSGRGTGTGVESGPGRPAGRTGHVNKGAVWGRRKSVKRMALHQLDGDMNQVRRLQYFRWTVPDPTGRAWNATGRRLEAKLGTREDIFLVDTTDMPKQGVHSVGVARQYCGRPVGWPTSRWGCSWPTPGRPEPRWSTGAGS